MSEKFKLNTMKRIMIMMTKCQQFNQIEIKTIENTVIYTIKRMETSL